MKSRKVSKVEKWKTIKIPEALWLEIKVAAAQKGIKIYQELENKYE